MADETTERIVLLLQARDRDMTRALDRVDKKLAKFEKNANKSVSNTTRQVDSKLQKIGASFRGLAAGAGPIAAVGASLVGLGVVVRNSVSAIASIGDEAKRSGLGVEAFQELRFVAEQSRIPVDALIDGMKELNLRGDEFATTGKGSAADAFRRLGLDADDLKRKLEDPKELMLEIIDTLEGMDQAAQIRIADEVFGGTGGERFVELIAQGDEGLRRMIDRGHDLGAVLDEDVIAKADDLDRRFGELATTVGAFFKSVAVGAADIVVDVVDLKENLEEVVGLMRAQQLLGAELASAVEDAPGAVRAIADDLQAINFDMESLVGMARQLAGALANEVPSLIDLGLEDDAIAVADMSDRLGMLAADWHNNEISAGEFRDRLSDVIGEAETAIDRIAEINGVEMDFVVGQLGRVNAVLGSVAEQAKAAIAGIRMVAGLSAATGQGPQNGRPNNRPTPPPSPLAPTSSPRPRSAPFELGVPDIGAGGGGGGGSGGAGASEYEREVQGIRERTAALELEAAELLAVATAGRDMGDAIEFARRKADLLHAAQRSGREITPELRAQVDAMAASYVAAGQFADDAADRIDRINENAERGVDTMVDLFMAIRGGADNAREALGRLLLEIAEVNLRSGILGLTSTTGAGSGIARFVGALFGARAMGGPVRGGVPYLVNENTPNSEVFVPSQSGAVLSVPQAQAAVRQAGSHAPSSGANNGSVLVRVAVEEGSMFRPVVRAESSGVAVEVVQENNRHLAQARRRS